MIASLLILIWMNNNKIDTKGTKVLNRIFYDKYSLICDVTISTFIWDYDQRMKSFFSYIPF